MKHFADIFADLITEELSHHTPDTPHKSFIILFTITLAAFPLS